MHVRPLWIVVALLLLPPATAIAGWWTLPRAALAGRCAQTSPILPAEADAVTFSRELRSAILDHAGGPFELSTTDARLTSYVAINTTGSQLADPQIHFVENAICLSGRLAGLGLFNPDLHVEVYPSVVGGTVQFEIRQLIVNGRMLPAWLRHLTQRIANESIQDAALPLRIDAIRIEAGQIHLAGERLR